MVYNHSSDIDIKNFLNLYGKCTAKPFSFLDIDTTQIMLQFQKIPFRTNIKTNHDN